ncbi:hypothetical protein IMZ48_23440 [Candidatus Bathyarchaeota archaeon]|nr:hypothetical protein [Candidatus Bathyarchaeota archaeon]
MAPLSCATLSLSVWSSHDVHVRRVLLVTSSTLSSADAGGSAGGESSPDIVERRSGGRGKLHREGGGEGVLGNLGYSWARRIHDDD